MGSGVYLKPDTFKFRSSEKVEASKEDTVDPQLYPEHYRKRWDNSEMEMLQPFCIGIIEEIQENPKLSIKVRKFYRPENTHKGVILWYQQDLNLLYWSDEGNTKRFPLN